jgi:hypothetical protein
MLAPCESAQSDWQSTHHLGVNLGKTVHLVKLCVGIDSVEHLEAYRGAQNLPGGAASSRHVTRMWPKRAACLLNGGSLYWVIKGQVLCRQRILRLDEVTGNDGIKRCGIVMDPEIIRTQSALKRPFQGWRYLRPEDAPPDLPQARTSEDALPDDLNRALAEIGVM